jgi:hypothetical protein
MTKQEIENVYEFVLSKRILKRDFPWIKDLVVTEESPQYNHIIPVTIFMDPYEFSKQYDVELSKYVDYFLKKDGLYEGLLLSSYVGNKTDEYKIDELENRIEETLEFIHNSPAYGRTFKLTKKLYPNRFLSKSEYFK